MEMPNLNQKATDFWDSLYRKKTPGSSGKPSAILQKLLEGRKPGAALELGCAKGDDAVWLAENGWQVTAVDISQTALDYAQSNARDRQVSDRILFQQLDLAVSFPEGEYDLVSAMFLQTPLDFPRNTVLKRAAQHLRPGGLLLVVSHGSRAPWSWAPSGQQYPTARQSLAELDLPVDEWEELLVSEKERIAQGPEGQTAPVKDTVLFLKRL